MRKVYRSQGRVVIVTISLCLSLGLTCVLFGTLPFLHQVAAPKKVLELTRIDTGELEETVQEESEEETTAEIEQPKEPPPQLEAQSDAPQQMLPTGGGLGEVEGGGGALVGFGGSIRVLTSVETAQSTAFDVSELEKRPVAVSQIPPKYPPELQKAGVEGSVTLVFVLNEQGRVEDPRVERSTHPEFESAALEAIRKWRFRPGMKDGEAVRTYIRIPMRFSAGSG